MDTRPWAASSVGRVLTLESKRVLIQMSPLANSVSSDQLVNVSAHKLKNLVSPQTLKLLKLKLIFFPILCKGYIKLQLEMSGQLERV